MKLSTLINPELIFPNLIENNKKALLSSLIDNLCLTDSSLKSSTINQLVLKREELCSTALDNYVAVPHARIPGISKTYACIGICQKGVDFGSIDELKTKIFILILHPENAGNFHLEILRSVATIFGQKDIMEEVLSKNNKDQIFQIIKSNEQQ